jgi:hypothetical protein
VNEVEAIAFDNPMTAGRSAGGTALLCTGKGCPRIPGPWTLRVMSLIRLGTRAKEAALSASSCWTTLTRASLGLDEVSLERGRSG